MKPPEDREDSVIQGFRIVKNRFEVKGLMRFILICVIFLSGSITKAQIMRERGSRFQNATDEDYYYALIEATKQFLLENYQEALSLYVECLRYKPESAAVNYQLSQIFIKAGDMNRSLEFARNAYRTEQENKWYVINLVNLYQNKGDIDSATIMMERLSSIEPYNMEYKYMLSGMYEQVGEYDKGMECLDQIEDQMGISKEVLIAKYGILRKAGREKDALKELRRTKTYFDDDFAIEGMMAEYFRDMRAYDSAAVYYESIIPEYLENIDVAVSYSEFLIETGMPDSARSILLDVISSNVIDERSKESFFYQLLQDENTFNRFSGMADTLSDVFSEKLPNNIGVQSIYADLQMRLGNYGKASEMLKRIFNNDQSNYIAIEQLIYIENLLDRQDSVIHYAKMGIEIFPSRPVPYLYLGSSLLIREEYSEAIQYMERGRRYVMGGSFKVQYYSLLAENYYGLMKFDSTWSCFEVALALDTGNIILNNNYAYYLAEQDMQLQRAADMSSFTLENDPKNPTYLDTYAWILYKMGKSKEAKKYLKKAIKYNGSDNAEILDHYGDILFDMGKYKDSVETWRKALQFDASKSERIIPKIKNAEQRIR